MLLLLLILLRLLLLLAIVHDFVGVLVVGLVCLGLGHDVL